MPVLSTWLEAPWGQGSCLFCSLSPYCFGFPGGTSGKESAFQCGRCGRLGFEPWSGRSPGGGNGWATEHVLLCSDPLSCLVISDSANPWTVAHQAPLSLGFSRQEHRSGLPFPFPGIFPTQGSNPHLLCLLHWHWVTWEALTPGAQPVYLLNEQGHERVSTRRRREGLRYKERMMNSKPDTLRTKTTSPSAWITFTGVGHGTRSAEPSLWHQALTSFSGHWITRCHNQQQRCCL